MNVERRGGYFLLICVIRVNPRLISSVILSFPDLWLLPWMGFGFSKLTNFSH